jgi:hypothetical protein
MMVTFLELNALRQASPRICHVPPQNWHGEERNGFMKSTVAHDQSVSRFVDG